MCELNRSTHFMAKFAVRKMKQKKIEETKT